MWEAKEVKYYDDVLPCCVCVNCMQTKNKEHAEQSEAHKKRVHKKCKGNEKLVELVAYFGAQPRQRQQAAGERTDGQTATTTPATVAAARLTMDPECRANWRALQQQ